jgi:hypothetical protein
MLTNLSPANAGAASGAPSTVQHVGNAFGVAITCVIFYGTIKRGLPHAYELSLAELAAISLAGAACSGSSRAQPNHDHCPAGTPGRI